MRSNAGEALLNLALLGIGILVVAGSVQIGVGTVARPGAGFFPLIAGAAILVPQMIVAIRFLYTRREAGAAGAAPIPPVKLLALLGILAGWVLLVPTLGYIIVTFLAVIALAATLGLEGGWKKILRLALLTSVGVYAVFDWLLFLDLPRGPIG